MARIWEPHVALMNSLADYVAVTRACGGSTVAALQPFLSDPNRVRSLQGTLDLRIGGYDDDPGELFELEDVRAFVHALDLEFPYWLYFSSVHTTSLRMIALCFLPPFLTDEGKGKHFSEDLDSLLERRWIPALEQIASFAQHPQADFTEYWTRQSDTSVDRQVHWHRDRAVPVCICIRQKNRSPGSHRAQILRSLPAQTTWPLKHWSRDETRG